MVFGLSAFKTKDLKVFFLNDYTGLHPMHPLTSSLIAMVTSNAWSFSWNEPPSPVCLLGACQTPDESK